MSERQNLIEIILLSFRLVGLYGPGEQRHLPRSVETIKRGYMKVLQILLA